MAKKTKAKKQSPKGPGLPGARALLWLLLLAALAAGSQRMPTVAGNSMRPVLPAGDRALVNAWAFDLTIPYTALGLWRMSSPARGDVVAFYPPDAPHKLTLKRVVGLPGETVAMTKKITAIDGKALPEPYARRESPDTLPKRDDFAPLKLPADSYFLLGDNRDESNDSRFFGPVPRKNIVGKAWLNAGPAGHLTGGRFGQLVR